jgi:hypothetical protein
MSIFCFLDKSLKIEYEQQYYQAKSKFKHHLINFTDTTESRLLITLFKKIMHKLYKIKYIMY